MSRIIVCIKQALDVTELKVDSATRRIITADAPRKISDFDKNALEEAVRLKEKLGGEVIVVTASPEDATMTMREALAMGADKAYMVSAPSFEKSDTLVTSCIVSEAVKKLGEFDLILCGEASVDSYSAQVGPRLAERLGVPQITYVRKLSLDGNIVMAERSLEDGFFMVAHPKLATTETPIEGLFLAGTVQQPMSISGAVAHASAAAMKALISMQKQR